MKKLRLTLDHLRVETFRTDDVRPQRGTVQAFSPNPYGYTGPYYDSCNYGGTPCTYDPECNTTPYSPGATWNPGGDSHCAN
ncbi:MAG TPA: hypothetical protein VLK84_07595 [Longimicrobium sp.]|nr:hypothetical protein [Longimicrobium sp.]